MLNSSPPPARTGAGRPVRGPGTPWPRLHPTVQAAFNRILGERGLSRAEVARRLGVSRTRVTAIARDLHAAGLIAAGGRAHRAATGRPAEMMVAQYDAYHFLGLHVDGDGASGAAVTLDNEVVWQRRAAAARTPQAVRELCTGWYRDAVEAGLRVAGLAVCGPWNRFGDRSGSPSPQHALADLRLPGPVFVEDDIVALAALEQWPLLSERQHSMVLVSVGPEVAFCTVTDRKIIIGAHGRAGRFGHVRVADEPTCPYGHRGCLGATSSATAIVRAVPGATTVRDVTLLAAGGDRPARKVLERAARGLGVAVGQLVNLIDPDKVVVVGDGPLIMSVAGDQFRTSLAQTASTEDGVEVDVAGVEDVEWARAAAALAAFRTLTAGPDE